MTLSFSFSIPSFFTKPPHNTHTHPTNNSLKPHGHTPVLAARDAFVASNLESKVTSTDSKLFAPLATRAVFVSSLPPEEAHKAVKLIEGREPTTDEDREKAQTRQNIAMGRNPKQVTERVQKNHCS
ncbi:MAG: hypothetical protein ACKO37_00955 [Vampirovibrionales bacterium]